MEVSKKMFQLLLMMFSPNIIKYVTKQHVDEAEKDGQDTIEAASGGRWVAKVTELM